MNRSFFVLEGVKSSLSINYIFGTIIGGTFSFYLSSNVMSYLISGFGNFSIRASISLSKN